MRGGEVELVEQVLDVQLQAQIVADIIEHRHVDPRIGGQGGGVAIVGKAFVLRSQTQAEAEIIGRTPTPSEVLATATGKMKLIAASGALPNWPMK